MSIQARPISPNHMIFPQVELIFRISRRTLFRHKSNGTIKTEKIVGGTYVLLDSLKKYLGATEFDRMLADWEFNPETGWNVKE